MTTDTTTNERSREADGYAGGYAPGDAATYRGPLAIDGEVTVVKWEPSKWRITSENLGQYKLRHGLVPVYSARFPSTYFWWVHPCQLTRHNAAGEVRRGSAVTSTGLLAVSDSERQA
jgi:hypothetical protein